MASLRLVLASMTPTPTRTRTRDRNRPHRSPYLGGLISPLVILGALCCFPCIWGYTTFTFDDFEPSFMKKRRMKAEARALMAQLTPEILGPRLERCLTIGREDNSNSAVSDMENGSMMKAGRTTSGVTSLVKMLPAFQPAPRPARQVTEDQSQSSLSRLPLEIRMQIYEEILGYQVIHISFCEKPRKMGHCRHKKDNSFECSQSGGHHPMLSCWAKDEMLPLLQTCRRM